LLWVLCLLYIDDILVFIEESEQDDIASLSENVERLSQLGFRLNKDKCEFLVIDTDFLGNHFTRHVVMARHDYMEKFKNAPRHQRKKNCKPYWGCSYFFLCFLVTRLR
jgi:hypothetical protein